MSTLAKPSDEERMVATLLTTVGKGGVDNEKSALGHSSTAFEEDSGEQHDNEVAKLYRGSGSCDSEGGNASDVCGCVGAETMEVALCERLSLAESLQAHWHWQDSSCLMMMTGRLRPICWTELPEDENGILKLTRYKKDKTK